MSGPDPLGLLDALSPAACGLVWAVALDAGAAGLGLEVVGASVGGPEAACCRAALAALAALPRAQRARQLTRLLGRVLAPVPPGIERVHPGWLRAALEGEATEMLLAITAGLPPEVANVAREIVAARGDGEAAAGDVAAGPDPEAADPDPVAAALDAEAVAELRRAVFAPFAAMPELAAANHPEAPEWQRLTALPMETLMDELTRRGAEVLGTSLAGAPAVVVARAAARAGEPVAAIVLEAARRRPGADERDRARRLVAAVATPPASAAVSQVGSSLGAAAAIGLLALAERLATESSESVRALAQRLPPAVGQMLLEVWQESWRPDHGAGAT